MTDEQFDKIEKMLKEMIELQKMQGYHTKPYDTQDHWKRYGTGDYSDYMNPTILTD